MTELKPCPCGRPIDDIFVTDAGQGGKWAFVTGNCCGEWHIEFRTDYKRLDSAECKLLAIDAWNDAIREIDPLTKAQIEADVLRRVADRLMVRMIGSPAARNFLLEEADRILKEAADD